MRKIETLTIYPEYVETILYDNEIVNGIWWKWWFNFDLFFRDNIESIPLFNHKDWYQLYKDIRRLSVVHDMAFSCLTSKIEFYFANYIFARDVSRLLSWTKWYYRWWVWISIFFLLNSYWKEFTKLKK